MYFFLPLSFNVASSQEIFTFFSTVAELDLQLEL